MEMCYNYQYENYPKLSLKLRCFQLYEHNPYRIVSYTRQLHDKM